VSSCLSVGMRPWTPLRPGSRRQGRKDRSLDNLQDLNLTMSELVAVFQGRMGAYVGVLEPTLADLELPLGGSLSDLLSSDAILVIVRTPL